MNDLMPRPFSKEATTYRTPPVTMPRMARPVAMPSWHARKSPDIACIVILIGPPRRTALRTASQQPLRCLHAYGRRGASALCGARQWHELVPADEATCPACCARLRREVGLDGR